MFRARRSESQGPERPPLAARRPPWPAAWRGRRGTGGTCARPCRAGRVRVHPSTVQAVRHGDQCLPPPLLVLLRLLLLSCCPPVAAAAARA